MALSYATLVSQPVSAVQTGPARHILGSSLVQLSGLPNADEMRHTICNGWQIYLCPSSAGAQGDRHVPDFQVC